MLFAILLSIFYCDDILAQSVCSACHGYGKVRTRVGMSTYGISNEKELCSKCGKWIYAGEDHYDTCTKCGGGPVCLPVPQILRKMFLEIIG